MAVDATMRKLQISPKFMPYMEKHRIYELFHDLGDQLAMEQPQDPLWFLKKCLERLRHGRDKRVILLMCPPYLDRIKLAQLISLKTNCNILSRYLVSSGSFYDPAVLAANTAKYVRSSGKEGWILSDFPDNVEEAKHLIKSGVLPTHAFLLLPDKEETQIKGNEKIHCVDMTPSVLLQNDTSIYHMRDLFQSSLKVVKIKDRSIDDLAYLCSKLVMKMPFRNAPKLIRMALLGPRGSRRRTLAKILHKQFDMVHVDMNNLLNTARVMDNNIGDEIRFLDKNSYSYPKKIVYGLIKNRLQQNDCIKKGYVMTNFPTSVEDFVFLDSLDTPPNRVIFIDIDGNECLARLEDRVVNMYTGKIHSKMAIDSDSLLKTQTLTHPDDETCKVIEEIKFYNSKVKAMLDYCGKTCSVIDGRGPTKTLLERVEAVIMGPSPAAKPRSGKKFQQLSTKKHHVHSKAKPHIPFPIPYMEVVPLIDSDELLRRFKELKEESQSKDHSLDQSEKSLNDNTNYDFGNESPVRSETAGGNDKAISEDSLQTLYDKAQSTNNDNIISVDGSDPVIEENNQIFPSKN